eukprot:COSAG06_NODE_23989_length_675_cov_4.196181_1_plen_146_part_01
MGATTSNNSCRLIVFAPTPQWISGFSVYQNSTRDEKGTHAQQQALFHSIRRSDWVTHLLQEISYYDPTLLFFMTKDPIIHFGDNSTATVRAKEHKTTINNRHVALKYHFIRDAFLKRRIVTDFVGTADNHSDLGTKATSPGTFKKL